MRSYLLALLGALALQPAAIVARGNYEDYLRLFDQECGNEENEENFQRCYSSAITLAKDCDSMQKMIENVQFCFETNECSSEYDGEACDRLIEYNGLSCNAFEVTCPGDIPPNGLIGLICVGIFLLPVLVAFFFTCIMREKDDEDSIDKYLSTFHKKVRQARKELNAPHTVMIRKEAPTDESDEVHKLGYAVYQRALELEREEAASDDGVRLIRDGDYSALQKCLAPLSTVSSHEGPGGLCCFLYCIPFPLNSLFAMLSWTPSPKYDPIDHDFKKPGHAELCCCPCLLVHKREGCSWNFCQALCSGPCCPCYAYCFYRPRGVPGYRAPCEEQCCCAPPANPQYHPATAEVVDVVPRAPEEPVIIDMKR